MELHIDRSKAWIRCIASAVTCLGYAAYLAFMLFRLLRGYRPHLLQLLPQDRWMMPVVTILCALMCLILGYVGAVLLRHAVFTVRLRNCSLEITHGMLALKNNDRIVRQWPLDRAKVRKDGLFVVAVEESPRFSEWRNLHLSKRLFPRAEYEAFISHLPETSRDGHK